MLQKIMWGQKATYINEKIGRYAFRFHWQQRISVCVGERRACASGLITTQNIENPL